MSIYVNKLAITDFVPMVHAEFQNKGNRLRGTMQTRSNVVGSQVRFQKMSKGMAKQKAPQDRVQPMNTDYTPILATMQDWYAADYSDIFKEREVNFDEKRALAENIAMAMGRRLDQIAIDALNASTTTNTIANGGTGFTYAKFSKIIEYFDDLGVPENERFLAMSARAQTQLLAEDKFINTRYVDDKPVVLGGFNHRSILGVTIILIPTTDEGGLPKSGNVRTNFAWQKTAAGYATGIDFNTEVNWIPEALSFLVAGWSKACATTIDDKGIVKIDIDESV